MNSNAAPPIDAPAIPPGLSFADEDDDEVGEVVALVLVEEVVEVVEELEVAEVVVEVCVFEEPELTATPLGVRSLYTAQSGCSAKGQLESWHKEYSCSGWPGVTCTGGEQRTLYCAFIWVLSVCAS